MDNVIIGIATLCVIYLFYNLIRIKFKKEKNRQNRIYALVIIIFMLMFIWNIYRQ